METNKRSTMSLYHAALGCMLDYRFKFEQTKKYIDLLTKGDIKLVDEIKKLKLPSSELLNIIQELLKHNVEVNEIEREILSNGLIKTLYSWIYHIHTAENKNLGYLERERGNYQALLQEIKLDLLFAYLKEEKNLKDEYESFKGDLKDYSVNLVLIAELADNKNNEAEIKLCIKERAKDANRLLSKYNNTFALTEDMFLTAFERDLIESKKKRSS